MSDNVKHVCMHAGFLRTSVKVLRSLREMRRHFLTVSNKLFDSVKQMDRPGAETKADL